MFNVIKFYKDYRIPIYTSGKHYRQGWVNTDCPFCKGKDGHLGIHINSGAVKCWKCGKHSQLDVIKALLGYDYGMAKEIQEEYSERSRSHAKDETKQHRDSRNNVCEYPTGTTNLTERHKAYLESRNFDPEKLEKLWRLKGTEHLGKYKFRIIAPIMFNGVMVSYQGRDITGKSDLRYKACKQENEIIPHQDMVYGIDHVKKGGSCVLVEGIFDVFRLGYGSVSCFGTSFTLSQVNLLASYVNRCFVLFDADDDNAINMAEQIAVLLSARGVEVELLELDEGDPAELPQEEADQIMKELGF